MGPLTCEIYPKVECALVEGISEPGYRITEQAPKYFNSRHGLQLVFTLKNLKKLGSDEQILHTIACFALEKFRQLYILGCNEKESITFQARFDGTWDPSGIYSLIVNPQGSEPRYLSQHAGTISQCYAYISEDRSRGDLCYFLNQQVAPFMKSLLAVMQSAKESPASLSDKANANI